MRKRSAIIFAGALLLAACGGDDDPSNAERPEDGAEPTPAAEVLGEVVEAPTPTAVVVVTEDPVAEGLTYTVQSGDTMGTIAANFGVEVDALAAANDIDNIDLIQVGQALVIPDGPADPG